MVNEVKYPECTTTFNTFNINLIIVPFSHNDNNFPYNVVVINFVMTSFNPTTSTTKLVPFVSD